MTTVSGTDLLDRILDAAFAEFTRYGLRRTSMEDVARRAGVGRATVYRKVPTKDALIAAVVLREGHRFMDAFAEVVSGYGTIADQIVEGWVFSLAHMRNHPLFSGLLFSDPEALLPFLTVDSGVLLAACREFVAEFIRAAQTRGEVSPTLEPEPVAELMVRIVISYTINPESCLDLSDEHRTRDFARRHLVPLIR